MGGKGGGWNQIKRDATTEKRLLWGWDNTPVWGGFASHSVVHEARLSMGDEAVSARS